MARWQAQYFVFSCRTLAAFSNKAGIVQENVRLFRNAAFGHLQLRICPNRKTEHGKERYKKLKQTLKDAGYRLDTEAAKNLLKAVSQAATGEPTSHTQWLSLYDLSQKSLKLWLLGEFGKDPIEIKVK